MNEPSPGDDARAASYARHSWPRFTAQDGSTTPAIRRPDPHGPWPRWGWFEREQRTWIFAPGPALTVRPPTPPPFLAQSVTAPPVVASPTEPIEARPIGAAPRTVARGPQTPGTADRSRPADRRGDASPMALVPVRRELMLSDAARAAKRVAPVAAVAGAVALVAMSLFRRR